MRTSALMPLLVNLNQGFFVSGSAPGFSLDTGTLATGTPGFLAGHAQEPRIQADLSTTPQEALSLSRLLELFLAEYLLERSQTSRHTWQSHARLIVGQLGDGPAAALEERAVRRWALECRKKLKAATVMHRLSFLRKALSWAVQEGLLGSNAAQAVKSSPAPNARHRYLSHEEEARLQSVMSPEAFEVVRFALLTGLRRFELFRLTPAEVDLKRGFLLVSDSKTRAQRMIPIHPEAAGILEGRSGAYVFCPKLNPAKRWVAGACWTEQYFRPALRKADIQGFRFHDLRHTFASRLVEEGVALYTVQALLGHTQPNMTQRYAHLSNGHLTAAVRKLG